MRPVSSWFGWRCLATVLLVAWSPFASPAPVKIIDRIATDASEIRIVFPHLFGGGPVESAARPKFLRAVHEPARGACDLAGSSLCYDALDGDGRIVYGAARAYMPEIGGLTAESVSVHRHGIRFKYTFR